jgi:putative transposase
MGRARIYPRDEILIKEGIYVAHQERTCKVRKILGVELVLIEYADTGETEKVHPWELRAQLSAGERADTKPKQDIASISDEEFKEAERILEVIKPLLYKESRTRADVKEVADTEGVSTATVYTWIKQYCETGNTSALVHRKKGPIVGSKRLSPEVEAIIEKCREKHFLKASHPPPTKFFEAVKDDCKFAKLKAPHINTLRARLKSIPRDVELRRRGNSDEADRLVRPMPGEFPEARHPLECVQVDHCELDMEVVYEETREPIGIRPWLTLLIDAFSRMIVGYFLSLHRPSSFAAGAAMYLAIMPKKPLLQQLGLPGEWPVFGKMKSIHADNAREFKGKMLEVACNEHKIISVLRPLKRPEYGAYIERSIGNIAREMQKKEGATQRKPGINEDYDARANSIYTLAELEVELVDWIVNRYHVQKHSELNTTPLRRYTQGIMGDDKTPGIGLPSVPTDQEKLRLDFLPFHKRNVHNYGVEIDLITFYDPVLNAWINAVDPDNPKKKQKFIFRWDPRSIRFIWFYDPELKQYFRIPTRDPSRPDISWSEFNEYKKKMKREGDSHTDEESVFNYRQRSLAREQAALENTRLARRQNKKEDAKRSENATPPGARIYASTSFPVATSTTNTPTQREDSSESLFSKNDPFGKTIIPFDDIDI